MQNPKFCAHVERSSFGLFNCMVVFVCMYLYEGERERLYYGRTTLLVGRMSLVRMRTLHVRSRVWCI